MCVCVKGDCKLYFYFYGQRNNMTKLHVQVTYSPCL